MEKSYWDGVWRAEDAESYRGYLEKYRTARPAFLDVFRAHGVRRVCDAACGFGAYSVLLHANGFAVTGFDVARGSLELTRSLLAGSGLDTSGYRVCDIRRIDFPDAAFDAAVAHAVIDHLPAADAATAVDELLRIVRPGGLVYLSFDALEDDDLAQPHTRLADGSFLFTGGRRDGLLFKYYAEEDIARLLAGRVVIWRGVGRVGEREVIFAKGGGVPS